MTPAIFDRAGALQAAEAIRFADRVPPQATVADHSARGSTPMPMRDAPKAAEARTLTDPGPPPMDMERVAELKRAIENGSYPLVPAKIADALIAAGMLLQKGK